MNYNNSIAYWEDPYKYISQFLQQLNASNNPILCVVYWLYSHTINLFYASYINTYWSTPILNLTILILLLVHYKFKEFPNLILTCKRLLLLSIMKIQLAVNIVLSTIFVPDYSDYGRSIFNPFSVFFLFIDFFLLYIIWIYFPGLYQAVINPMEVFKSSSKFFVGYFAAFFASTVIMAIFSTINFVYDFLYYVLCFIPCLIALVSFHSCFPSSINIMHQIRNRMTEDE